MSQHMSGSETDAPVSSSRTAESFAAVRSASAGPRIRTAATTSSASQTITAVDWTASGIILSCIRRGSSRPEDSAFFPWPEGINQSSDTESIAAFLRRSAEQCSWSVRNTAVSVPRQLVSLRMYRFPRVADSELAGLIDLQLESRQYSPGTTPVWDVLLHPDESGEQRVVSVVSVPEQTVQQITAACRRAGWKTQLLTSADLLIGRGEEPPGWVSISVQVNRAKLEVTALRSGLPVTSIATNAAAAETTPALASLTMALIHRVIASLPDEWRPEITQTNVMICGSRSFELLHCPQLQHLQLQAGPDDERSPRSTALAVEAGRRTQLNFLKPGHAVRRDGIWRQTWFRLGTVATLLAATAAFLYFDYRAELQQKLTTARERMQSTQALLERGAPLTARNQKLQQWNDESVNPAQELSSLLQMLPADDQMLLTRLTLENIADSGSRAIRLEGQAESVDQVHELNHQIMHRSDRYRFQPQGIEPAPSGSDFKVQFRMEAQILQRDPDEPSEAASPSAAEAPASAGGQS